MQKITPYEITKNPFSMIGKQWAMITTRRGGKINTMTASWGGVGILWNKPVAYIFIRPQRFTRELLNDSERFSICFLPEELRQAMTYCGKESGRDGDKLAACGLTARDLDGAPALEQSEMALVCKKLYCQQLSPACFLDKSLDGANYPGKDYHYMYVAEIESAYQ